MRASRIITVAGCITLLLLLFVPPGFSADEGPRALFKEAFELTVKGEADRALELYDRLLKTLPRDPDLLYNAGTASLLAGRLGPAVLYLERALALDPGCEDCRINLERANELQRDRVIVKPTEDQREAASLDDLMESVGLDALAVVVIVFQLTLALVFVVRRLARSERLRFALTLVLLTVLVADLSLGGLLALKIYGYESKRYAVVLADEAAVRKGPNVNFPEAFTVHEGLKVQLGERVEDWRRIWLANGLNGYIPLYYLGEIRPEEI